MVLSTNSWQNGAGARFKESIMKTSIHGSAINRLCWGFFLTAFTFFYIYQPRPLIRPTWQSLALISYVWIAARHGYAFIRLLRKSRFRWFLSLLAGAMLYAVAAKYFAGEGIFTSRDRYLLEFLVFGVPCAVAVALELAKTFRSDWAAINLLIVVALLQAFFCLLAFYSPAFRERIMLPEYYALEYNVLTTDILQHRIFGYSTGLLFAVPVLQAYVACLVLVQVLLRNWYHMFWVPILLFSGIINARFSAIIFIAGLSMVSLGLFFWSHRVRIFIRGFILTAVCLGAVLHYFLPTIENATKDDSPTLAWLNDGMNEASAFMQGNSDFNVLLNEMIVFPQGEKLIYGTGHLVFGSESEQAFTSDNGFINDLWFGGLFMMALLYAAFIVILWPDRTWPPEFRVIQWMTIGLLALANMKGMILYASPFIGTLMLIVFYNLCKYNSESDGSNGPQSAVEQDESHNIMAPEY